jgi:2-oxoisovalerate dehydrogenase E2 component (dihydrolipoyl transacylase)
MKIFYLPDLGEGLADAEIRQWHVKVGDVVKVDQPLVCMETAKAVVEVPSPQAGCISKLYGNVGDVIDTGAALVEFENNQQENEPRPKDQGSVVGSLEEGTQHLEEGEIIIGSAKKTTATIKAMPVVRTLAKQLNVDISLVTPTGPNGQIVADDVKKFAAQQSTVAKESSGELFKLHGVRRAMALAMTQSHQEIVPVTIVEDADITDFGTNSDMTVRLIQAIVAGAKAEPAVNAWYDSKTMERRLFNEINIGLAVDTEEGLFVPVLKEVAKETAVSLRSAIDGFKKSVKSRTISPSDLHGATFTLSNFGMITGRYATPIIVPPMVAILGCGKIRDVVVARQGKMEIRRIAPLSLTFDHRAVTGGEATRFLGVLIKCLEGNSND